MEAASPFQGHRFDQFTVMIQAATTDLGVALLPRYLIEQELESGQLQVAIDVPLSTEKRISFRHAERELDHPTTNELYR